MANQPRKLDLDSENPSLKQLLAEAEKWGQEPASALNPQQQALVHLHSLIQGGAKPAAARAGEDCFICMKGA